MLNDIFGRLAIGTKRTGRKPGPRRETEFTGYDETTLKVMHMMAGFMRIPVTSVGEKEAGKVTNYYIAPAQPVPDFLVPRLDWGVDAEDGSTLRPPECHPGGSRMYGWAVLHTGLETMSYLPEYADREDWQLQVLEGEPGTISKAVWPVVVANTI